jgi:phage gp29-like protein
MADEKSAENAKPVMEEIAVSGDGRDITKPYIGPLEINQDSVIAGKGAGIEIYEEVMRDDQVFSCFQQRRLAVISREWQVDAGATDKQSVMAADFLREMLSSPTLLFDNACNKMMYATFYGYGIGETMWAQDGRHVFLEKIQVRRARRFRFDTSGGLRLLTRSDMATGELMPPKKFWTWTVGGDNDDLPYGLGLGHHCYWPAYFKRNGMKFWLMFLEKFGAPTTVVKIPPGTENSIRDKALAAAQAVSTDAAVAIPNNMVLELLEAARSGAAGYDQLYDKMEGAISKVILSQTMTTDNGASLSQGKVHFEVREEVSKSDSDLQCASFMAGPARWLSEWNFPGAVPPRVYRLFDDPEDLDKRATRDKTIYDMGFEPSEGYVQETYGGDWTKRAPMPTVIGPAFAEAAPKTDTIGTIAELLASEWEPVIAPIKDQAQEAIDKSSSFADVRRALAKIDPDVDALAKKIEGATFQATAGGAIGATVKDKPKAP